MWKDIKNYEGIYQINENGVVKRLGTSLHSKSKKDKILKYDKNSTGYLRVTLSKNNNIKRFFVHRLVYETFIGDIPKGMTINHIDINKTNNNILNLELKTQQENNQLKSNLKLDKSKVLMIRNSKLNKSELSELYGVTIRTIERVIKKDRWGNV